MLIIEGVGPPTCTIQGVFVSFPSSGSRVRNVCAGGPFSVLTF